MTTLGTHTLTRADIRKIEEALNTYDLEVMVAVVDRIVELRLRAARTAQDEAPTLATKPIVSVTPISGGRQPGKQLLTFADGTRAIFKPASGERERSRTE
jgi:hypothetical protein